MDWLEHLSSDSVWQQDKLLRFDETNATHLFHKSVPVLEHLDWKIHTIERGYCKSILPINIESSNQYITQQAALMLLAADYTGGVALCTLFDQVPVIGFHPQKSEYGAYMWGVKSTIRWHQPSTSDLICTAQIEKSLWSRLAKRFFNGFKVIVELPVLLYSDTGELVAQVDFTYWAWDSNSLRKTGESLDKTHILFRHKVATSAKLIAGIRALCQHHSLGPLQLNDPIAKQAAGKQGLVLAKKFCGDTPGLKHMVAARTLHLDQSLEQFLQQAPIDAKTLNIVNLGTGFDTRAWRINSEKHLHFFELDLPVMLNIREQTLPAPSASPHTITRIALDLRNHDLYEVLRQHQLDPMLPTFFIWEGGSMYFEETLAVTILRSIQRLMRHAHSQLWMDFVDTLILQDPIELPGVDDFMHSMRRMGEPFIMGYDNLSQLSKATGFKTIACQTASELINSKKPKEIFQHYFFANLQSEQQAMPLDTDALLNAPDLSASYSP